MIAVAGGFGFLGSNLVKVLQKEESEVVAFSRRSGIDIRDTKAVSEYLKTIRPEIVINAAAHVGGIAYNAMEPVGIFEDNLMIGFNLLEASFKAGVRKFVNIMPNCTYPGVAEIYREDEWWNGPMHESVLTYGMPRKALWVQAWALRQKYGFDSIHLVLPNLYGPNDHFDPVRSHALGALVRKIVDAKREGKETIEIWGTGTPVREWGYVEDAAQGVILAITKYSEIEIMNIGEGRGYTIGEIADMIRKAAGWHGGFTYDSSKPDGAPRKILDVSKMERVLNWRPPTSINDGIMKTIQWYQENQARGR